MKGTSVKFADAPDGRIAVLFEQPNGYYRSLVIRATVEELKQLANLLYEEAKGKEERDGS